MARAVSALVLRVFPSLRVVALPADVARARRDLLSHTPCHWSAAAAEEQFVGALTLAVGSLRYKHQPDWSLTFDDREITASLHRWNWLLRGITDDHERITRDQGIALMRSWIGQCLPDAKFGTDAYSTGERIVNGCLFLRLTGDGSIPQDLQGAFRHMGRQVARNVEYDPLAETGNHAFNNARALLFAEGLAALPGATDLAFAIAAERLPHLVTRDGFLREGSSHYHFLFTRWVLEMLWLGRCTGHTGFIQLLSSYAARLVAGCWFFLVRSENGQSWQMPLIGDLSPDFPPDWLISLPWSSLARSVFRCPSVPDPPCDPGWADLFGGVTDGDGFSHSATTMFPESGWYRIEHMPWSLFIHTGYTREGARFHAHHDLVSFVLFRHGEAVIVDPGRVDYTSSPIGRYGRSASAHNTVLLDGLGPTADGRLRLLDDYRAAQASVDLRCDGDRTIVTLQHDGFGRLAGVPIAQERRFEMTADSVKIDDHLTGAGLRHMTFLFHFAPGIRLRPEGHNAWALVDCGTAFRSDPMLSATLRRHDSVPIGGVYAPAYGRQAESQTLELSRFTNLPVALSHHLIEKN